MKLSEYYLLEAENWLLKKTDTKTQRYYDTHMPAIWDFERGIMGTGVGGKNLIPVWFVKMDRYEAVLGLCFLAAIAESEGL